MRPRTEQTLIEGWVIRANAGWDDNSAQTVHEFSPESNLMYGLVHYSVETILDSGSSS